MLPRSRVAKCSFGAVLNERDPGGPQQQIKNGLEYLGVLLQWTTVPNSLLENLRTGTLKV